ELDLLLVDVPPGTDKIARLLELVPELDQMLLVTTPAETSRFVVSKSVRMAREAAVGTVALVANMAGHTCPECGHVSELFTGDGANRLEEESGVPIWAEIPFDPRFGAATDSGTPLVITDPDAHSSRAILELADRVEEHVGIRTEDTVEGADTVAGGGS
ncbi:MAG: P-loop NTPase, partial [Longimicrobiales bacterium]